MTTVLIISVLSFFLLAATAVFFSLQQRKPEETFHHTFPPRGRRLFGEPDEASARRIRTELEAAQRQSQHEALLARATQGDLSALDDAHAGSDSALYREVLNTLTGSATGSSDSADRLRALAAHIAGSNSMRASIELATGMIELWKQSPDKQRLGGMLHIAALADDAATYQLAVEAALERWRNNNLPDVSAAYLLALIESESWVIASEARQAEASFVLKQTLSNVRRELAANTQEQ
ncbi:MAG TPA: hypothetical protein VFD58_19320 [Blastocatellia bacterium]|nr:hypothetical protein [Blastocatellia bacterium]